MLVSASDNTGADSILNELLSLQEDETYVWGLVIRKEMLSELNSRMYPTKRSHEIIYIYAILEGPCNLRWTDM